MNGIQNRKSHQLEEPVPGCLGRMVNLFDLSAGVARNRLITDKPHHDYSLSRSRSDVARILSHIGDPLDDKLMVSELRGNSSSGTLNGTPMKMLIAQEMSKEVGLKHNSPNVIAKLMGLDALACEQPGSAAQVIHSKGYSEDTQMQTAIPLGCLQGEHKFFNWQRRFETYHCQQKNEFKDVYEIWPPSEKMNQVRDSFSPKGTDIENTDEKKMALIRQKFLEAKRLSTNEKLRQSKEFQDALEILNSDRDLLIKFLQEPNSMFSPHVYEMRSSPPPQTRQITVLRPSKIFYNDKVAGSVKKAEKQPKKSVWKGDATGLDKSNHRFPRAFSGWKAAQTTRIVVIKPTPGKTRGFKAMAAPLCSSPRMLNGGDFCVKLEDGEVQESREVANEITHHMHKILGGHQRDETLLSSVLSNGYIGDESSFNKSENEFEAGNLSDSRHSWDHASRFDSPYSSSIFSRTSFSPESSVCREAKKRLSQRWAMMASNGTCQEQRHARRNSSTLGEMLDLPDMKKLVRTDEGKDSKESTKCLASTLNKGEGVDNPPRNLLRSKSVPVSSTLYGDRFNVEVSDADTGRINDSKELRKTKSAKSSFKGKVSSLFFSRNKKSSKENFCKSLSVDVSHTTTTETPGFLVHSSTDGSPRVNANGLEESLSPCQHDSASKAYSPDLVGLELRWGIASRESVLHAAKSATPGNPSENQEQPSPISVLLPPFEEDDSTTPESSGSINHDRKGMQMPNHPARSNLIDRSPLIEPMARRSFLWDDYSAQLATPHMLKHHLASSRTEEEAQDWLLLVQTLLSVSGLESEMQSNSFKGQWHSPGSPLGPSLREKYVSLDDKGIMHEAKRRQQRANWKLVFDCVNATLADIIGYESSTGLRTGSCGGEQGQGPSLMLVDRVWARMKEWCVSEVAWDGNGDGNSLVVERVARKEVVDVRLMQGMRREVDTVGQEIGSKLLEELLEEEVGCLWS